MILASAARSEGFLGLILHAGVGDGGELDAVERHLGSGRDKKLRFPNQLGNTS